MILFSASYSRGTPSARLRAYDVCTELCRRGIDADIIGPDDGIDCGRQRFASLRRNDVLYMQKWASNLHRVHELDRCIAKVVYDFDDLTSAQEHRMLLKRCDAFVVGAKTLAQQVISKPVLIAATPLHPALFGDHIPYKERISRDRPGVVVAKYGFKPYLGKLGELAPELNRVLDRHGYSLWFLGAHHASEYKALKEMYPTCSIYPLVKMDEFYEVQVPMIKQAAWGFVPYNRRCKGKSATSVLTLMACGVPVQAFAFGECGEMFGRRLRRWAVNTNERFFENAERLMTDPAQAERFIEIADGRVREYSLNAHCDRLVDFLRNLGVVL